MSLDLARRFAHDDDVPGPDYWRGLASAADSLRLRAAPPLLASGSPSATRVRLDRPAEMDAIITARATHTYSAVEAWYRGGAFVPMPGGRSVDRAYPYNPSDSLEVGAPCRLRFTRAGTGGSRSSATAGRRGSRRPRPPPSATPRCR